VVNQDVERQDSALDKICLQIYEAVKYYTGVKLFMQSQMMETLGQVTTRCLLMKVSVVTNQKMNVNLGILRNDVP
jgi:hypothetical protein